MVHSFRIIRSASNEKRVEWLLTMMIYSHQTTEESTECSSVVDDTRRTSLDDDKLHPTWSVSIHLAIPSEMFIFAELLIEHSSAESFKWNKNIPTTSCKPFSGIPWVENFPGKRVRSQETFLARGILLYWLSEFSSPPPFASSWASGPCAYLSLNQWNFLPGLIENRTKSFHIFSFEEKFAKNRKGNKTKRNIFLCEKSTRFGVWARTTSGPVFHLLIWLSSPFRKLKNHWKTWKLSHCFGWKRCNPLSNFRCLSASRYIDMFCNWTKHPTEFSQLSLLIILSTVIETEKKFPSCQCHWEAEIPANSRNIVRFNDTETEINNRTDLTPSRAVRAFTN